MVGSETLIPLLRKLSVSFLDLVSEFTEAARTFTI